MRFLLFSFASLVVILSSLVAAGQRAGYYRYPALHGETVYFVAEGDVWRVPVTGGLAQRLTTGAGSEMNPVPSPDGTLLAFTANYEGPTEVYTMPTDGGLPTRRTFEGARALVVGWTPEARILYRTRNFATAPDWQLATVDLGTGATAPLPLASAADGDYDPTGRTLFFTRLVAQGDSAKRYQGGFIEQIWSFTVGAAEAVPLTTDYAGTSRRPMAWNGRVYFASDRDGTMNLWSMQPDGRDLRQHTRHAGWDVFNPRLDGGRIVYQLQADVRLFNIATGEDRLVPITLASDFEQTREHWVKKPLEFLSSLSLAPDGSRVALTVRGNVFVAPVQQGRLAEITRDAGVRWRAATFLPDGKSLIALSDKTGETEFWTLPANGVGAVGQLTRDANVLRFAARPSPDGTRIAFADRAQRFWVFDLRERKSVRIPTTGFSVDTFDAADFAWSPDGKWIAFTDVVASGVQRIYLYELATGQTVPVTTDRLESYSPAWSADGQWLYFLSEREFHSLQSSPWGPREPEPFFDKTTRIYLLDLVGGQRSPWQPDDELARDNLKKPEPVEAPAAPPGNSPATDASTGESKRSESPRTPVETAGKKDGAKRAEPATATKPSADVKVALAGLPQRLFEVPVPAGNYRALSVGPQHLFVLDDQLGTERRTNLLSIEIKNREPKVETLLREVKSYELSADRKKLLVRHKESLHVIDANGVVPAALEKTAVDLGGLAFSVQPRDEWRQILVDAWRQQRDYFYDRNLHGLDWHAVLEKHLPLVERLTNRDDLNHLLSQMMGELATLHVRQFGGDIRNAADDIQLASLGARLTRDESAGGWRVARLYRADPDFPGEQAPLAAPGVNGREGDVIEQINGVATLSVVDPHLLLRHQAGRQVLLRVKPAGGGDARNVIVTPITASQFADLRYADWKLSRRERVEQLGGGRIGYVHLKAMGESNIAEFVRGFYPVFDRPALIVDVRYNNGGNIDSWILARLMRRVWAAWQARDGLPAWNMQYAFRGHMVVLVNSQTASDGETFAEGFRRLGLGKLLGTRTWGGGVWIRGEPNLVDGGSSVSAEYAQFGVDGAWLIEGRGVDPDIVVDDLPRATFDGQDAQLEAAAQLLLEQIEKDPRPAPVPPAYPKKAFRYPAP